MKLLVKAGEIRAAFRAMRRSLLQGAQGPYTRSIGWQGGNDQFGGVWWHERFGFWTLLGDGLTDNRYWCCFGLKNPQNAVGMMDIVCEINPPFKGDHPSIAGMFVQDGQGRVCLAHSGRVSGGKKGVGKSAFLRAYRGRRVFVSRAAGKTEVLLLGRVDDPRLGKHIRDFIDCVARFKRRRSAPTTLTAEQAKALAFRPEFAGSYEARVKFTTKVRKLHGEVINALASALRGGGYRVGNDKNRDLLLVGTRRRPLALFEAKTGVNSTSIYTGVGQLMVHGAVKPSPRKRVLVLPSYPHAATAEVLHALSIKVLTYSKKGGRIVFDDLEHVLRRA